MKRAVTVPANNTALTTPLATANAATGNADELRAPALPQLSPRLVDEVILLLQETEPAAALRRSVEVYPRHLPCNRDLVDEVGMKQVGYPDYRNELSERRRSPPRLRGD